jgi:hypothetical protein
MMPTRFTPFRIVGATLLSAALFACDGANVVTPDGSNKDFGAAPMQTPVMIHAVFSGPPNRDPNQISLNDPSVFVQILNVEQYLGRRAQPSAVRIGPSWETGTPAQDFAVLDINNDGNRDIQLRFNTQQLINAGHLGQGTTQLVVWGRDATTGQNFTGTANVTVIGGPGGDPGSISTAPANNGSGGVFMDLTPTRRLDVVSFEAPFSGTVGTTATVQVWTRPGSYVGFDGNPEGWTLTQTVEATRQGLNTWAPIMLTAPIPLQANQTTAVYLQVTDAGGGLRYTGTAANPPQTTWSNDDLTLFSDVARVTTTPFAGSRFTPRTFSGTVNYLRF